MKLSMWSSYYIDLSPEEAVLELEKNGYTYTELSDEHAAMLLERGDVKSVGAEFRCFADSHHVSVLQGHLYLKVALCSDEYDSVKILKKWLDLFEAIGIRRAVLHCDNLSYKPELGMDTIREMNKAALKPLLDYIEGKDIIICLENLRMVHKSVEDLLWYIEELDSGNLGICLDTGHLNISDSSDQVSFIKKAGKHLKALHIADNEGERDQHIMPFGIGSVDMASVVKALKEIGYDGLYNFEIPGERKCPLEIRGYKMQYLKQCMAFIMKG